MAATPWQERLPVVMVGGRGGINATQTITNFAVPAALRLAEAMARAKAGARCSHLHKPKKCVHTELTEKTEYTEVV